MKPYTDCFRKTSKSDHSLSKVKSAYPGCKKAARRAGKNNIENGFNAYPYRGIIACEESGIVRDEFTKLGFDVTSCDLQPSRTPGKHYQGSIFDIIDNGWDFMIAHPPCTFMSKAGARWMFPKAGIISPERFELAMEAKEFFMRLLNSNIPNIAVENPFPLKVIQLPECTQTIQPYQFGDPFSKKTLLWLKGFPELKPTNVLTEYVPYIKSNTGGKKRGQSYRYNNLSQKDSSKTFPGIARAMAEQWGEYLLSNIPI